MRLLRNLAPAYLLALCMPQAWASGGVPPHHVPLSTVRYEAMAPAPFGHLVVILEFDNDRISSLVIEVSGSPIYVGEDLLSDLKNPGLLSISYPHPKTHGTVRYVDVTFEVGRHYEVAFTDAGAEPIRRYMRDIVAFRIDRDFVVTRRITSFKDET